MRLSGIIWLEEVVEKLHRKHGVEPDEVEEILEGRPRFRRIEAGRIEGEDLYAASGRTLAGRYLLVFFLYKTSREALIVSARELSRKEKRRYAKK
ncbi:MAG TPA: BrnT family toxin [Thermoanaerobaculia bacterium]|nr:BrnT family toxin [Thermoanaerobaculia bacterium]